MRARVQALASHRWKINTKTSDERSGCSPWLCLFVEYGRHTPSKRINGRVLVSFDIFEQQRTHATSPNIPRAVRGLLVASPRSSTYRVEDIALLVRVNGLYRP